MMNMLRLRQHVAAATELGVNSDDDDFVALVASRAAKKNMAKKAEAGADKVKSGRS